MGTLVSRNLPFIAAYFYPGRGRSGLLIDDHRDDGGVDEVDNDDDSARGSSSTSRPEVLMSGTLEHGASTRRRRERERLANVLARAFDIHRVPPSSFARLGNHRAILSQVNGILAIMQQSGADNSRLGVDGRSSLFFFFPFLLPPFLAFLFPRLAGGSQSSRRLPGGRRRETRSESERSSFPRRELCNRRPINEPIRHRRSCVNSRALLERCEPTMKARSRGAARFQRKTPVSACNSFFSRESQSLAWRVTCVCRQNRT